MKKSTKNQIKAEFFEFLRENDCASKFCVNFYNKKGRDYRYIWEIPGDTVAEYLNEKAPGNWVLEAFHWDETVQGYDYWSEIRYKWEACVIEYNFEKKQSKSK